MAIASRKAFTSAEVVAIRDSFTRGDLVDARRRLDAIAASEPLSRSLLLLHGDLCLREGEEVEAERSYRQATADAPELSAGWVRLVRLLARQRRVKEARELFLERIWGSAVSETEQDRLIVLLTSSADREPAETLSFLGRIDQGDRTRLTTLIRRAVFRSRLEQGDLALADLDRAAAAGVLPPYAAALRVELLLAAGRADEALTEAEALTAAQPDEARHFEKLVHAAALAEKTDVAVDALREGLRRHPSDWWLLLRFNRLSAPKDRVKELFGIISGNASAHAFGPKARLQYALACIEQGRLDEALKSLDGLERLPGVDHISGPLAGALKTLRAAKLPPARVVEDRDQDFKIVADEGADALLVVFAGLMNRFCYLPVSLLDRVLARFRCHVAYLQDGNGAAYLRGVKGFSRSEDETVAGLFGLARDLGATRILTLGGCVGGFAAMRHGGKLQAEAALSLAGPTALRSKAGVNAPQVHVKRALGKITRPIDALDDLRQAPELKLIYAYSDGRPSHVAQVDRLRACPGLLARPLPTDSQLTALESIASGAFFQMLSDDLALRPA